MCVYIGIYGLRPYLWIYGLNPWDCEALDPITWVYLVCELFPILAKKDEPTELE